MMLLKLMDGFVEVYFDKKNVDNINIGDIVRVKIVHNTEYDLVGNLE